MASLNKAMIIGNLGRDPEVTYTPGGLAIAKLNIATTDTWSDKTTGEKRERTEWHRVTLFGKLAELSGRYLAKGRQVYIEGRIQTSTYEKDGTTRYSTEIIASSMQFLGGRQEGGAQQNSGGFQGGGQMNQGYAPQNNFQGGGYQQGGGFQQGPPQDPGFGGDQGGGFQAPPDDDIPF